MSEAAGRTNVTAAARVNVTVADCRCGGCEGGCPCFPAPFISSSPSSDLIATGSEKGCGTERTPSSACEGGGGASSSGEPNAAKRSRPDKARLSTYRTHITRNRSTACVGCEQRSAMNEPSRNADVNALLQTAHPPQRGRTIQSAHLIFHSKNHKHRQ
jgi:hypothetical protein